MESFRQKLAHNSRVSLGPRDIKLLQECITSERKLVDQAQRLAAERDKASHALREWAGAEGPDLNDVVSKVCTLYDYLSKAEMAYAEHNGNYRIRFKEIRSKEETLAGLKKSRDSLGGRIEAQDRKVSKMKEENKDLPAQKQRLRDMQQEMVGLEHSVLTEETRLGDFKRAATRAALSLKLGAMLELAEKTVIIAELGKLMVDMLPTDETEPGQPRAYYDGYSRTEELLSEAQRCLQDVVFNPAPITEGFAAQHHGGGGGGGYATDTYRSQLGHGDPSQPGYGDGSGIGGRDQYDEMGGIRPIGGVDSSNDYGSQTPAAAASHYRDEPSYGSYSSPYEQPSHSSATGADASEGSLRHGPGPRLQPLPDFRPISSFQPMGDDAATSQWSDARRQPYHQPESAAAAAAPTATPVHDAFASSSARTGTGTGPTATTAAEVTPASPSTALAPPIADLRSSVDRSSLAYMGSELDDSVSQQQHAHEETSLDAGAAGSNDVEAREAAQAAREDAAARSQQQQHTVDDSDAYEAATPVSPSVYTRQTHGEGPTPTEEYHPDPLPAGSPSGGQQQNPLSPIVEVATPAMTQVASPDPNDQDSRDFRSSDYAHPGQGGAFTDSSAAVVPNSSSNSNDQYADQRRRSYTPTAISAAAGSYPSSYATGAAGALTNAPSDAALYNGEYSQQQPRARQVSAERQSARVASPTPYGGGLPDVPSSPAGATSSFEPRPLGSSRFAPSSGDAYTSGGVAQRRPIQIRAPGSESSNGPLGSKYGDIQVGGSPLYAPSSNNTSGGNNNNDQKRTLPAGAFRRPPPPQVGGGPASPGIGIGSAGGGRQFSASGYQYDPAAQQQQQATPNSSESAAIAQRWRDSSIPPLSSEQQHELEQAGEGEMPVSTPSFDVRPLQVHRAQNGNAPRSGSVPPTLDAAHLRSSSYGGNPAAGPYDQGHSSSSLYGGGASNASTGANGQDGFGSNRFVTRLD
ncbi:hypothetical protein B0A53_05869 [Rhodotorula sp. CCFEE 5036]|nr:hypothetical protein B0A53_05869 [Rhodotorula sp. CCFEE 5036]